MQRRLADATATPPVERPPEPDLEPVFKKTLSENFSHWDRDGDARLTISELDHIMSGGFYGEWTEDAQDLPRAATLATVRRYSEFIGAADPYDGEGVTQSDLMKFSQGVSSVNEAFSKYLDEGRELQTRPIAMESIAPEHVAQGTVGSCVMLSTLIGLDEGALRAMIEPMKEGQFEVHFPDGSLETVPEPTLAERFYHAVGQDGDRWPAILEKAMGQKLFQEKRGEQRTLRAAIDGVDPERALEILTGGVALRVSLDEMSPEQTRRHLQDAFESGGPVICASRPEALSDFISVEELHNGIINSHCYAVLGYDQDTDTVTLRNPWHRKEWAGSGDGIDDGRFEMPLVDFYCSFRWVAGVQSASA